MATLPNPTAAYGTLVEALQFDGSKNPDRRVAVENSPDGALALTPMGRRTADAEVLGFARYTKTIPTYAAKMQAPFRVSTLEGLHEGKMGDYLAIGPLGEMYPIAAEVMEESYVLDEDLSEPLRMKVEPDGSISQISGGPLDHSVDTGPTEVAHGS